MGSCYPHLSLEERRKIAKWGEAKMPVPEITVGWVALHRRSIVN